MAQAQGRFPGITIVGTHAPPFGPFDDGVIEALAARITSVAPQIVWVGLGTPKQDFVAARLVAATNVTCVAVGAAFDFLAGTKREAPGWVQWCGLEWLFRLMTEPRRLWRRYLLGNARFLRIAARDVIRLR